MTDAPVVALEATIADAGALLVEMEKYRRGALPEAQALRAAVLGLGDRARRAHHRDTLDDETAAALLGEAHTFVERLQGFLRGIRAAPEYQAALVAHGAADAVTLARTLPRVFAGLEPVPDPPDLHHPVPWRRRGRPLPPAEIAAAIANVAADGIPADGDDLAPGRDPGLPAVALTVEPTAGDPLVLRLPGTSLPGPVWHLADGGDYLLHVPRLKAPFTVLVRRALGEDELEASPVDYPRWRAALLAALDARALRHLDG